MKRVLVDKNNNIVFEGTDAKEILRILNANVYNVSEEDEVKYEHIFRPLIDKGELKFEVHFDLEFAGIDDWNRPVFKDVDSSLYFGSTEYLYGYDEFKKVGLNFFKLNPHLLEYFGSSFDCEPHGGTQKHFKFNIITKIEDL